MGTPRCLYHNRGRAHFAPGVPFFNGDIGAVWGTERPPITHPIFGQPIKRDLAFCPGTISFRGTPTEGAAAFCCCIEDDKSSDNIQLDSEYRLFFGRRRFDLNVQFAKLFEFHLAGGFGHEIHRSLGLGERDAIANVIQSTEQHDNAIDA